MGIVLDTSALIAIERGGSALANTVPSDVDDVCVPAVVIAELWIGVELAESSQRRRERIQKIRALLDATRLISFDERLAPTYARVYAELRAAGTPIPANDLAVSATALFYRHQVLVGPSGEEHFRRVRGLEVRVLAAG